MSDVRSVEMSGAALKWHREEQRRAKQAKRAHNRDHSTRRLRQLGIAFETVDAEGWHLRLQFRGLPLDFYPSTGNWVLEKRVSERRGIDHFLAFLETEHEHE